MQCSGLAEHIECDASQLSLEKIQSNSIEEFSHLRNDQDDQMAAMFDPLAHRDVYLPNHLLPVKLEVHW